MTACNCNARMTRLLAPPQEPMGPRAVLGWTSLIQSLWATMDEVISLGRRMAQMSIRSRVGRIAELCNNLGYVTPSMQPLFPQPVPPAMTKADKRIAYERQSELRDRCGPHTWGKPYARHGYTWMVCLDCDRRWRRENTLSGPARWGNRRQRRP